MIAFLIIESLTGATFTRPVSEWLVAVKDSSRYFVVRVRDPQSGRTLSLGIGFRERSCAFDLFAALNDKLHSVQRQLGIKVSDDGQVTRTSGEDADDEKLNLSAEEEARLDAEAAQRLAAAALQSSLPRLAPGERMTVQLQTRVQHASLLQNDQQDLGKSAADHASNSTSPISALASVPSIPVRQSQSGMFALAPPPSADESLVNAQQSTQQQQKRRSGDQTTEQPAAAAAAAKASTANAADEESDDEDAFTDFASAAPAT